MYYKIYYIREWMKYSIMSPERIPNPCHLIEEMGKCLQNPTVPDPSSKSEPSTSHRLDVMRKSATPIYK